VTSHEDFRPNDCLKRRLLRVATASSLLALAVSLQLAGASIKISSRSNVELVSQRTTGQIACSGSNSKVARPMGPHGLFELGKVGGAVEQYAMRSPLLCGADVYVDWSSIDMGPGHTPRYDWAALDNEIAPWEAAGKEIGLIISGASEGLAYKQATPAYVASEVTMVDCPNEPPVPVFWQSAYLSNWGHFMQAVVEHFASDAHIAYMRFGVTVDGEGFIPGLHAAGETCLKKWDAVGYASDWPRYIQDLFTFEGSLHSPHKLVVSLNYDDMASTGPKAVRAGIGAGMEGMDKASATAVLQHEPCPFENWCAAYIALAGKTPLYLEMYHNSDPTGTLHSNPPSPQELTGPLPPLLQAGVELHAQIFEIYPQDWLLALDPQYPGYAKYHAEYVKALTIAASTVN